MSRTIQNYAIPHTHTMPLYIERKAAFLCVELVTNTPHIFFEVDPSQPREMRYFDIYKADEPIPPKNKYMGCVIHEDTPYFIYEVT